MTSSFWRTCCAASCSSPGGTLTSAPISPADVTPYITGLPDNVKSAQYTPRFERVGRDRTGRSTALMDDSFRRKGGPNLPEQNTKRPVAAQASSPR